LVNVIHVSEMSLLLRDQAVRMRRKLSRGDEKVALQINADTRTMIIRTSELGSLAVFFSSGSRVCVNTKGLMWLSGMMSVSLDGSTRKEKKHTWSSLNQQRLCLLLSESTKCVSEVESVPSMFFSQGPLSLLIS
jgi:hypothetical protein